LPVPDLYATLADLGIQYERYDHAAVFTCEESHAAVPNHASIQTKNLFLRDKRGRRHILLITTCEKAVDIKEFTEQIDADRLSFGSPERMMKYLGVEPGSVTVFGLINDSANAVELYVDEELWGAEAWRCHPLVNTATLVVARRDVERFVAHTGHKPRVLKLRTV
jgi:Ala-tRNA(Pro) deacylase